MEHRDDAPLADEPQAGAIPNDQPMGDAAAPASPGDDEPPQDPPPPDDD
jgi:hypothetical protein